MNGPSANVIRVLILSTRPKDQVQVAQFLAKRGFHVIVRDNLREGLQSLVQHRPHWVFLSINLAQSVEKCGDLISRSFKSQLVYFADVFDLATQSRLDRMPGHVIGAKLSGPGIQLKLHQLSSEGRAGDVSAKHRLGARPTSGVRKSDFGLVRVTGDAGGKAAPSFTGREASETERRLFARLVNEVTGGSGSDAYLTDPQRHRPGFRALNTVDEIFVMVWMEHQVSGFILIASSLEKKDADSEVAKLRDRTVSRLSGALRVKVDSFPEWAQLRACMVKRYVCGMGEVLACFIPERAPLPSTKPSAFDPDKIELQLGDVPTDIELPCPMHVHLPQNNKFVCLIKEAGLLTLTQQERLRKVGVSNLFVANEDMNTFLLFYVRERLALRPASTRAKPLPAAG